MTLNIPRAAVRALLAVSAATACGGAAPPDCSVTNTCVPTQTVATVTVTPALDTIIIGATVTKTASPKDASGAVVSAAVSKLRFTSSAPAVATVDSITGVVTGVAIGSTTITASVSGVSGTATVVVKAPAVASVVVTPALDTILIGATVTKSASPRDAGNNAIPSEVAAIRFTSSAVAIATVDAVTGVVTGVAAGTATITATAANNVTGTATVVVKTSSVPATITIAPVNPSIGVGLTVTLTASAVNAAGQPVTPTFRFNSSAPTIASVDSVTGQVTGVAVGTATITVRTTPASVTATTTVTVTTATSLVAKLPNVFLTTAYVAPTGTQIVVAAGGNLQTALTNAAPGDEILLAPGATYAGSFTIPAKAGSAVIHIRTNIPYASLPAEGSRMTPALAASLNLAKIVTLNQTSVFTTATGASNYRFVGVEVGVGAATTATGLNALIRAGDPNQTTLTQVSTNLVFDRMYIHGDPAKDLTRGIILSSANTAIIDSYISDVHVVGADAQALWGGNGPGPYKIVNNYLEASGENVMFGGSDPAVPNLVPSDIEVRHNHFFKPVAWNGSTWLVKNLFEIKNAQRLLVEGNIFSNNWAAGQVGYVMNLKSVNQGGPCTWCVAKDITVRYNYLTNAGSGISINGTDPNPVDSTARRIVIQDNVMDNINVGIFLSPSGTNAAFMQIINHSSDVIVNHNTFVSSGAMKNSLTLDTAPGATFLTFTNNILGNSNFGVKGTGTSEGNSSFATFTPGGVISKNIFVGANSTVYPTGNFFPANYTAVGFTSFSGLNYQLTGTSTFRNAGTDGRDIGADISVVNAKIAGVIVP